MIRVLQCVNNMHRAGLETMLMNYYRSMDRSRIQFDFLVHRPERSDYDDEIEALGGRIFRAPRLYPQNYPAYFAYMKRFFREHPEYRIIHSHIDAMSYLPLLAAKKAGVPVRIAHSHSTSIDRDMKYGLKQFFRRQLPQAATHFCACGDVAGQFLFRGRPFHKIPNAIDAARFRYDGQVRSRLRVEMDLEDRLVVGHVGRFSYPKNHSYLLRIFDALRAQAPDAVLLLVGAGEKEEQIRDQIRKLGLEQQVMLLGSRSDVNELYQAMDVFVMPSLFEGVPVVGVEAQYAGLPCVFSDRVPTEVAFTQTCRFLPLEDSPEEWARQILESTRAERGTVSEEAPFDISNAHQLLTQYYTQLLEDV